MPFDALRPTSLLVRVCVFLRVRLGEACHLGWLCKVQSSTHETKSKTSLTYKKERFYISSNSFNEDIPVSGPLHSFGSDRVLVRAHQWLRGQCVVWSRTALAGPHSCRCL
jgi:hypothetical protein